MPFYGGSRYVLLNAASTGGYGPELIVNGTFDSNVNSWNATASGGDVDTVWDSGTMSVHRLGGTIAQAPFQVTPTLEAGATYSFSLTVDATDADLKIQGNTTGTLFVGSQQVGALSKTYQFTMTGTAETVTITFWPDASGATRKYDNVSLRKVL